jgi:hypothetical protein
MRPAGCDSLKLYSRSFASQPLEIKAMPHLMTGVALSHSHTQSYTVRRREILERSHNRDTVHPDDLHYIHAAFHGSPL